MRAGMFPFARPERALIMLAVARWPGTTKPHCGPAPFTMTARPAMPRAIRSQLNAIPALMAGTLGLECYGMVSSGDANSPLQMAIDNEYIGAVKRFANGFEVSEETLAWKEIMEAGIGGTS